ncbi:MAG: 50S ribosomal protein L3 [Candidatus Hadarchaeales archaeon]
MGKTSRPRRGSLAFSPRVRAKRPYGRVQTYPTSEEVRLQLFPAYKAGMSHVFIIDDRKGSLTYGQEISVPVTVLETPPVFVCAVRIYAKAERGKKAIYEVWAKDLPKQIFRKIPKIKKYDFEKAINKAEELVKSGKAVDVRAIICTQPWKGNVPKKTPEIVEAGVSGKSLEEKWEYCKKILGTEIQVSKIFNEGEFVDVIGITKGKGFQGPVKRWGIKILPRKTRKGRRQVGSIGPWTPAKVMWTVPMAGQMGYHQRTELNKRILKIGTNGEEITPKGGFLRYGPIRSDYIVVSGSVPGTTKRLLLLRQAIRPPKFPSGTPTITYISLKSQQG